MNESTPTNQEVVANKSIEDTSKIKQITFVDGGVACESCERKLRGGDPVTAFSFRPADQPAFQLGNIKCTDCRPEPTEYFTLGVRELVLDGAMMHRAVNSAAGLEGSG
jgi:hypothetical protein